MNILEQRLRFAMVAYVGGCRPAVSCADVVRALAAEAGVLEAEVSVHGYAPEDFLVVFAKAEDRNKVAALPCINHGAFTLFFRPWNRQAQATHVSMRTKVNLVLEGVPPHAWDCEVVEDLLGKSCALEEVSLETRSRRDLSTFRLTAWTTDVEEIPVARTLVVPEPVVVPERTPSPAREFSDEVSMEPESAPSVLKLEEIKALKYKVLIHVTRVEEPVGPEELWFASRPSDSGQSGLPEEDYGGGGGGGVRLARSLPWQRGMPDRRRGGTGGAYGLQRGLGQLANREPRPWMLPAMQRPGPLVIQTKRLVAMAEGTRPARACATPEVCMQGEVPAAVQSDPVLPLDARTGPSQSQEGIVVEESPITDPGADRVGSSEDKARFMVLTLPEVDPVSEEQTVSDPDGDKVEYSQVGQTSYFEVPLTSVELEQEGAQANEGARSLVKLQGQDKEGRQALQANEDEALS
jgi:hypothetical protein